MPAIVRQVNVVSKAHASFKAIRSSVVRKGSALPVRLAKIKAVRWGCVRVNQAVKALVIACLAWLVRMGRVNLGMSLSSAVAAIFVPSVNAVNRVRGGDCSSVSEGIG